MPQPDSTPTYLSLKLRNPGSVNGAGERNSQAQNAVTAAPASLISSDAIAKPCVSGNGRRNRTRSIAYPGKGATPAEYWNGPGMNR